MKMVGLFVALGSLGLVVIGERIYFSGMEQRLKAKEQAFKFHALRDDLQLLVANGQVEPSALTYTCLMGLLNFAIRNAGVMKLRDILALSRKIQTDVNQKNFQDIQADIKRHDAAVQELSQRVFFALADMLISNDWLVRTGVKAQNSIEPAVRLLNRIAGAVLRIINPERVQAVGAARRYFDWGNQLSPCH